MRCAIQGRMYVRHEPRVFFNYQNSKFRALRRAESYGLARNEFQCELGRKRKQTGHHLPVLVADYPSLASAPTPLHLRTWK